jgi:hypothetical protein
MVGWPQYRQPGSRTSPSIHRQVRTGMLAAAPAGAASLGPSQIRTVIAQGQRMRDLGPICRIKRLS